MKLENCLKRLYAYGGKELNVVGQIQMELSVGTKKINSKFVVKGLSFSSSDKVSKGLQWNWQAERVQAEATRGSRGYTSSPEAEACSLCLA